MCCEDGPPILGAPVGLGPPPRPPWLKYTTISCNDNHSAAEDPVYKTIPSTSESPPPFVSSQYASSSSTPSADKTNDQFQELPTEISNDHLEKTSSTPRASLPAVTSTVSSKQMAISNTKITSKEQEFTTESLYNISTVNNAHDITTAKSAPSLGGASGPLSPELTAVVCLGSLLVLCAVILLTCWFQLIKKKGMKNGQVDPERTAKYYNFLFNARNTGRRWRYQEDTADLMTSNRSSVASQPVNQHKIHQNDTLVSKLSTMSQTILPTDGKKDESPNTLRSSVSIPLVRQDSSTSGISVGYAEEELTLKRVKRQKKKPITTNPPSRNSSDSSSCCNNTTDRRLKSPGDHISLHKNYDSHLKIDYENADDIGLPPVGNRHFCSAHLPILEPINTKQNDAEEDEISDTTKELYDMKPTLNGKRPDSYINEPYPHQRLSPLTRHDKNGDGRKKKRRRRPRTLERDRDSRYEESYA